MSLYDYGLGTLAQYELTADRSARTRGALLCYTAQGLLILREFHGSEKKLEKQQELLMKLQENGINTDYFLRNNQESLVSKDKTEQRFTLQHWYEGKECNVRDLKDLCRAVQTLAQLHLVLLEVAGEFSGTTEEQNEKDVKAKALSGIEAGGETQLRLMYTRHMKELKLTGNYLKIKKEDPNLSSLHIRI